MQASKIKLGETYAATMSGKTVALTAIEIVTVKARDKTENSVNGYIPGPVGTGNVWVNKIPVADLIDEVSKHKELLEQREERNRQVEAIKQARKDKQLLAVNLLAKAINAQAVEQKYKPYDVKQEDFKQWDEKAAAVMAQGDYGIELNEQAYDNVINTFGAFVFADDNQGE